MSSFLCVFSGEEYEPTYYEIKNGDTTACLATGFSKHNAKNNSPIDKFSLKEAIRISDDDLYNVAVIQNGNEMKWENCELRQCE